MNEYDKIQNNINMQQQSIPVPLNINQQYEEKVKPVNSDDLMEVTNITDLQSRYER